MKDPLLIEQRYGLSEASSQRVAFHWPLHPLYNYVRHPERYHPPVGGESFDDLYRRAEQFIRESLKPLEGQYDAVLVSAHGAILCALQGCMFDVPVSDFWTMILPNCGIRTILMDQGVFTRQ